MRSTLPTLGDLELAVLEEVWRAGEVDAKAAHQRVGTARAISLNTVQSTLERLFRKGLLQREKVSHAYRYRASLDRRALVGRLIEATVGRIAGSRPELLMSAFVDIASRAGDRQLEQLEALIASRRAARREGRS